jgi:nitrogen fixation/metabolism regulation signal transduction histidine kinase
MAESVSSVAIKLVRMSKDIADLKNFISHYFGDSQVKRGLLTAYQILNQDRLRLVEEIKNHAESQPVTKQAEGGKKGSGTGGDIVKSEAGAGDGEAGVLQKSDNADLAVRRPPSKVLEAKNSSDYD